ncbi:NAD(P)/FAD-dependent oxidoreductase [Paenibacillus sp. WQ 127069]|uniref:NAD(P)/FAD-dependent oxidoreductase n=1 Tax=Paenibacillus baimaensis TaxID=2982185 RepID=A0ABT2U921_9BACL|nr:NAD(P)/FAD-dependent oxidoreductase [Paenibacillus sp. WQ 127069]MCU6791135.1 NAD(P)/FAD-dependent oxidoreductase [Paenibacillus sp. WQ 127069]
MNPTYDAAILGAGIAGSSLAKKLADQGWDTVLIDRQLFPRHKVCGEFLSPESQHTLKALGLMKAVESLQPSMITRIRLIFSHGAALEIPLPGHALGVSRYLLDSTFHNEVLRSGAQLQTATSVTSVYPNEDGYTIETKRDGLNKQIQARTVIAAWGTHRRSVLPRSTPKGSVQSMHIGVKSHYSGIEMEPVVELYVFPGGYLGISPIEGGLVNVAALLTQSAFGKTEKTILGMIDAAARRSPKLYRKLAQATPVPGTQSAVSPIDLKRRPLAWDVIPHVGDAALMIPPLCGDGMSIALRSARLCGALADRYLRGDLTLGNWRHEYTQSIHREFKRPMRWGRFLQWLFGLPLVPRLLPGLANLAPGLAIELVRATRLQGTE